jgi:ABC-type lipoprotein export system ATPase subunit
LTADRVYELIAVLAREERCTAVIVSHDPGSARIGDRVIRIRDGRVAAEFGRATGGEDTIVVGRGGWIQLPEELLLRAGIQTRARARVEEGAVVVEPVGEREAAPERVERTIREPRAAPREASLVAELHDVSKAYRAGTGILRGLNAKLRSGRLYALTGPSGSGKTTMLNLVAGLDLPSGGEVTILGTPLSSLDRAARARFRREHVAIVSQQVTLTPFLSARENVEFALALRGISGEEGGRRALEALDDVGLTERATQRVSRRSPRGPRCSLPTSRPRGSTRRTRGRSRPCSRGSRTRRARRSSAPRTTPSSSSRRTRSSRSTGRARPPSPPPSSS